jgi:integrase
MLEEHRKACPWAADPDGLVFGKTRDTHYSRSSIHEAATTAWARENKRRLKEAADGNGLHTAPLLLDPVGLHECRHTYVSIMHAAGFALEEIGDYVGHTSKHMTDHYRHLLKGHERETVAKFDRYRDSRAAALCK